LLVGGGVVVELAGPVLAGGPVGLGESAQSFLTSTQITSAKVLIAAQAGTMGVISANIDDEKVLQLLEEEMVYWEYWRP
jgi:hypothetical protein